MDKRALEQFGHNALGQFRADWTVEQLERRFAAEDAKEKGKSDVLALQTQERSQKGRKNR